MSAPNKAAPADADHQEQRAATLPPPTLIRRLGLQRYAIVIVFVAMFIAFSLAVPSTFLSIGNLSNILGGQAVLFILVMAVMLPTIMATSSTCRSAPRLACRR